MHRLAFVASGIAGQALDIQELHQDDASYTDGHYLYINSSLTPVQQVDAVLFQSLLLRAGSLEKQRTRALLGQPGLTRSYLVLEIYRAMDMYQAELPSQLISRYPKPDSLELASNPAGSLVLATKNRRNIPKPLVEFGRIRPLKIRSYEGFAKGGRFSQAELSGNFSIAELAEHDEDAETETSSILAMFKNPLSDGNNALSRTLNKILGSGTSGSGEGDDDDEGYGSVPMERGAQTLLSNQSNAQIMPGDHAPLPSVFEPSTAEFQYPEWDENRQHYKPDFTLITELDPWEEPAEFKRYGAGYARQLQHQMSTVGVEYQRHSHQPAGEDFDLDAIVNYAITLNSGNSPDESIYRMSRKSRRDLSTLMLLDISGSTKDFNDSGVSIHEQQASFVEALATALYKLGDQVAMYGFHSWGSRMVRFMRIKAFTERGGSQISRRIKQLRPSGYSRLGAAIRHATYLISQKRLTHHLLLLFVTDGFAYDDGYEDHYAEADTVKALEEARNLGIACACVSIGTDKSDQALTRTFGNAAYIRCETLHELPRRLRKHLQSALNSAAKTG